MSRQSLCLLSVSFATLVVGAVSQGNAAIIGIPDALNQTGNYTVNNPVGPISGENSVYVVGTMTFDNAIDTTDAFDVVEINAGGNSTAYQWGHEYATDNFTYFNPGPFVGIDSAVSAGESYLSVLKIDQTTGDYSFFIDPDLSMTEDMNTSLFDRTGGPTGDISAIQFRGGNGSTSIVDFTGFSVFTGDDTPFSLTNTTVPEPSTIAIWLIIGAIVSGSIVRWRSSSK